MCNGCLLMQFEVEEEKEEEEEEVGAFLGL
jgi:hypothetical protein